MRVVHQSVYPHQWKNAVSSRLRCERSCKPDADAIDIYYALCAIRNLGCKEGEEWLERIEEVHNLDLLCLEHPEFAVLLADLRSYRNVKSGLIMQRVQQPFRLGPIEL